MKKRILTIFIALVVTTCFAFCLSACDAFQPNETIYGHWVTEKQITQIGNNSSEGKTAFNITINEDGTMTATKYPEPYTSVSGTGTWIETNGVYKIEIIYENGDTADWNGTINKKRLTLKQSDNQWGITVTYIMTKSN